jgi:hypothetical protein
MQDYHLDFIAIDHMPRSAHVSIFCPTCQRFSVFVVVEGGFEWVCIGDPHTNREGCGRRLAVR